METVRGEVAHLALLDALVVAAGKPGAGAGRSRTGAAICQRVSHKLLPKLKTTLPFNLALIIKYVRQKNGHVHSHPWCILRPETQMMPLTGLMGFLPAGIQ